ncbi:MAG: prepilin peptidase [Candidatus Diapherotrites archaeon]|nr:prepilin peptidase [Candidatus Diapherotrites archaeon]
MIFELAVAKTAIAVIGTLYSAIVDAKTKLVPQKTVYSMIGLGIILTLASLDFSYIISTFSMAALVFGIGYVIYYTGQMGGGDILLFTGLVLLLPTHPFAQAPETMVISLPFILPVIFVSAYLAMSFMSPYYLARIFLDKTRHFKPNAKTLLTALAMLAFTAWLTWFFVSSTSASFTAGLLVGLPLAAGSLSFAFKNEITKRFIIINLKPEEIEDEEVLATELLDEKTAAILETGSKKVLEQKDLEKIIEKCKKHDIKTLPVYRGSPAFVPFIFLSLVLNLAIGDFMYFVFALV